MKVKQKIKPEIVIIVIILSLFIAIGLSLAKYILGDSNEVWLQFYEYRINKDDIRLSTEVYTKDDVSVEITTKEQGLSIQYKLGNSENWIDYKEAFIVTENTKVEARLVAKDSEGTLTFNGPITEKDITNISAAKIGNTYYRTLDAAIKACPQNAGNSQTKIDMLANVEESVTVSETQNIVLDLNGRTVTGVNNASTITNNGTLTISGESGTITSKVHGITNNSTGNVIVTGGTITAEGTGIYNAGTGNVTVNGGTITANGTVGTYMALGAGIYNEGTGTIEVQEGTITATRNAIYNRNIGIVTVNGGTITSKGTGTGIYNELKGTIEVKGGTIITGGHGIKNGNTGNVTVTGGTIETTGTSSYYSIYNGSGTITVTEGTITAKGTGIYTWSGTINVEGGTITAGGTGIYNDNMGTINVKGGIITAGINGIYHRASGTVRVTGGTIISEVTGIYNSSDSTTGYVIVTEGTIIAEETAIYNQSGNIVVGNKDYTPSNTNPSITGKKQGINIVAGKFYFYSGIIRGTAGSSISGSGSIYPLDGHTVVKGTEEIDGITYETSILKPAYKITYDRNYPVEEVLGTDIINPENYYEYDIFNMTKGSNLSIDIEENQSAKYGKEIKVTVKDNNFDNYFSEDRIFLGSVMLPHNTLKLGSTYTVSAFVKASSDRVIRFSENGGSCGDDIEITTSWQKVTYTFFPMTDSELMLDLCFMSDIDHAWKKGDTLYIHSLEAEEEIFYETSEYKLVGTELGTLPTASKEGYIFEGWYTDSVGGVKVKPTDIPTGNTTYYAHWSSTNTSTLSMASIQNTQEDTIKSIESNLVEYNKVYIEQNNLELENINKETKDSNKVSDIVKAENPINDDNKPKDDVTFEASKDNEEKNTEDIIENNIKVDNNIQTNIKIEEIQKQENSEVGYEEENAIEEGEQKVLDKLNILENVCNESKDAPYATITQSNEDIAPRNNEQENNDDKELTEEIGKEDIIAEEKISIYVNMFKMRLRKNIIC